MISLERGQTSDLPFFENLIFLVNHLTYQLSVANGFARTKLLLIILFFCVKKGTKNVETINVIFRNKKNICKKYSPWKNWDWNLDLSDGRKAVTERVNRVDKKDSCFMDDLKRSISEHQHRTWLLLSLLKFSLWLRHTCFSNDVVIKKHSNPEANLATKINDERFLFF